MVVPLPLDLIWRKEILYSVEIKEGALIYSKDKNVLKE